LRGFLVMGYWDWMRTTDSGSTKCDPKRIFDARAKQRRPIGGESSEGSAARIIVSLGTTSFHAFLGRGQLCQKAWFYAHEYLLFRVEKTLWDT